MLKSAQIVCCLVLLLLSSGLNAGQAFANDLKINSQIETAMSHLSTGKQKQAVQELERLSNAYPKNSSVWLNLSRAYLAFGDFQGAVEATHKAINLEPRYYDALAFMVHLDLLKLDFRDAEKLCKIMLQIDPKRYEAYQYLGYIYAGPLEQSQKALLNIEMLKKVLPNDGESFYTIAIFCKKGAISYGSKLIASSADQKNWLDLSNLALKYAIQADSKNAHYHLALAQNYMMQNRLQEANNEAKIAKALAPHDHAVAEAYTKLCTTSYDIAGAFKSWLDANITMLFKPQTNNSTNRK